MVGGREDGAEGGKCLPALYVCLWAGARTLLHKSLSRAGSVARLRVGEGMLIWGDDRKGEMGGRRKGREVGREIEAKGTRIHCVALCCPEGGVLTLCVSFLSFFFSLLYKQQSPETLGLGRVVESASWPPGVPHRGRGLY